MTAISFYTDILLYHISPWSGGNGAGLDIFASGWEGVHVGIILNKFSKKMLGDLQSFPSIVKLQLLGLDYSDHLMGWLSSFLTERCRVGCCTVTWLCPLPFDTVTMGVVGEKKSLKYSEPKASLWNSLPNLTVLIWSKLNREFPLLCNNSKNLHIITNNELWSWKKLF